MGCDNKKWGFLWNVCEILDLIKLRPCADWTRFMHLKTFIPEHDQHGNTQWHQCQMFCLVDLVMQMTLLNRIRSFLIKALLIHSENIASFSDDLQTINCLVAKLPDTTEISNDACIFSIVSYFHVNKMYPVSVFTLVYCLCPLRKHAYSNILNILRPPTPAKIKIFR